MRWGFTERDRRMPSGRCRIGVVFNATLRGTVTKEVRMTISRGNVWPTMMLCPTTHPSPHKDESARLKVTVATHSSVPRSAKATGQTAPPDAESETSLERRTGAIALAAHRCTNSCSPPRSWQWTSDAAT